MELKLKNEIEMETKSNLFEKLVIGDLIFHALGAILTVAYTIALIEKWMGIDEIVIAMIVLVFLIGRAFNVLVDAWYEVSKKKRKRELKHSQNPCTRDLEFQRFVESRTKMTVQQYCDLTGESPEIFLNRTDEWVYCYFDHLYIEIIEDYYYMVIGNEEFENESLSEMEAILFNNFY